MLKSLLFNPMALILIAMVFFVVALVDSIANDASQFSDLGPIGKIFTCLMGITVLWFLTLQYILPLFKKKE